MQLYRCFAFLLFGCSIVAGSTVAADSSDWMKQDIAVYREKFLAVDRAFTSQTRAKAEDRLAQLERNAASLTPAAFAVELCRIAALADNGHTGCLTNDSGYDLCKQWATIEGGNSTGCELHKPDRPVPDFKSVPIAFRSFGNEFDVTGVDEKQADLLGARLVAVDGKPIESMRDTLRTFAGGVTAVRDLEAADVLASPERLHAAGLARSADSVTYSVRLREGRVVERKFAVSSEEVAMKRLSHSDHASWAFRDPDEPFRYRDAPELQSVVVQLRQNLDGEKQKIADFLEEAEKVRERLGRPNIVLDMRFNGGGNLLLTRNFMARWPARVPGRFFVLTSPYTFSAGIASIAYLKQADPKRVMIVGEPVGDRLMFFSDGRPVQLPHSGRFFLPATVRMDYHDGCRKYDDCFMGVAQPGRPTAPVPPVFTSIDRMPVAIDSLDPDVPASWTIESWLNGTDPMLDAVKKTVSQR
jgi:hypothetical protein